MILRICGERNCGFAVDGDEARGYTLTADWDADGDLTNEEPIRLQQQGGYYTARIERTATDTRNGETTTYPFIIQMVIVTKPNGEIQHRQFAATRRRGVAVANGRRIPFALSGMWGIYDQPTSAVWLDLDGNGRGADDANSPEVFRIRERQLTIGGAAFGFRVDHTGRSLVLVPQRGHASERPSLTRGTIAPDFSLTDIDGHPRSLKQHRGEVVLLDFWAIWCSPCKAEAPLLSELDAKYRRDGLTILGLSPDPKEDIRKAVSVEVHQLYRVLGYPTHGLVGRDGRIVS
jgi:thiol-disulfide isomerase/thioredoxin